MFLTSSSANSSKLLGKYSSVLTMDLCPAIYCVFLNPYDFRQLVITEARSCASLENFECRIFSSLDKYREETATKRLFFSPLKTCSDNGKNSLSIVPLFG
ncbi:hypothetical protein [Apibacter mensalis]|uniref:hypothetical protein n=1 Tax=Apibacter mensalis TaxID=1586267 RepID=UPI0026EC8877|nr:hypothetical protein [Apibacter mensalis]